MQRDIFLIGSGQTTFGELWSKSLRDLAEEAVAKAIADAGCLPTDIDAVVVANMLAETANNQAHLGAMASALLPHRPPALRVEAACASGSVAIHTACALLESGRAETVLVLGIEKMTDVPGEIIAQALMSAADAEDDLPSGLTFPGIFGLIAQRYMHEYGLVREDLNFVSACHHRNAAGNPHAHFHNPITPEDVEKSPLVADPLHVLDCSPVSDGAAACILSRCRPERSRRATPPNHSTIRIAASALAHDTLSITQRPSITAFPATIKAMDQALTEASITRDDICSIEHHDCFSIAAIMNIEDLGFAEKGHGIDYYKKTKNARTQERKNSCNASGGLKACGHPVGATGVKQVIETARQLKKNGGRWGLAHNFGGACATCCVTIIENLSPLPSVSSPSSSS